MLTSRHLCPALLCLFLTSATVGSFAEEPPSDVIHEESDVIVTASRYGDDTHLSQTNITQEDLQFREPDLEIPMLMQDIPGVYAYTDAGSGLGYTYLKIRGFDQQRIGVLVNGIPFNDPEDHQVWWVDMPDLASSVEDIQVQRGVTNSIGGLAPIGGTVNLMTSPISHQESGSVSLSAGSYGFGRQMIDYHTGDLKGGFRSLLRLTHQMSDGFRQRSGVDQWAVFWSGVHETDNVLTQINIYTGREQTHHAWDASPASALAHDRTHNPETYHNAIDDFTQPHYELHNTVYLTDNLSLKNSIYYVQGEGFYENFKNDRRAADFSLDNALGLDPDQDIDLIRRKYVRKDQVGWVPQLSFNHGASRLVIGGDVYTFHSNHWGNVLGAEGYSPEEFLTPDVKYFEYVGDKDAFSLYANESLKLGGLTLMADVQYQHKKYSMLQREVGNFTGDLRNAYTVEYDFLNPKGALHYQIPGAMAGGKMAVYGSVGMNHREPTDSDLFDTWEGPDDLGVDPSFNQSENVLSADGSGIDHVRWFDPKMKDERVIDYEMGMAWKSSWLSFTLGGYWMDFRDEIVAYGWANEDGGSIRGNAEKTLHRGLELGLRARIDEANTLKIAASRSWDKFDTFIYEDQLGSQFDYSGNPIALFPEHLLSAGWETRWDKAVRTRLTVRNVGKQYLDHSGNGDRTIDPWTTIDISAWFHLGELGLNALQNATAFIHVRNIGDVEYETAGYYNPWGGVDWSGENHYTPGPGRNFALGINYDF